MKVPRSSNLGNGLDLRRVDSGLFRPGRGLAEDEEEGLMGIEPHGDGDPISCLCKPRNVAHLAADWIPKLRLLAVHTKHTPAGYLMAVRVCHKVDVRPSVSSMGITERYI